MRITAKEVLESGWQYHEAYGRTSRTWWGKVFDRRHFSATDVASDLGVPVSDVVAFETARDNEAEDFCRSEGLDY